MINKILLAIFALIAGVAMTFVPRADAENLIPDMDWYDEIAPALDRSPPRDVVAEFLLKTRGDTIYFIPTWYGGVDAANTGGIRNMSILSVPVGSQITIKNIYDENRKTYHHELTYDVRPEDNTTSALRMWGTGDGYVVENVRSQIHPMNYSNLVGPSSREMQGGFDDKVFPPVIPIDITKAVWGSDSVDATLRFYPLNNQVYGDTDYATVFIQTNWYKKLAFAVDGVDFGTATISSPSLSSSITLLPLNALAKIKSREGEHLLRVNAYLTEDMSDSPGILEVVVTFTENRPPGPTDPEDGNGLPVAPSPPDSSWDLVGWLRYIVDWILYIVDVVIWLLKETGTRINEVFQGATGFIAVLTTFFSFLPVELRAVLGLGLMLAILLRVFKR